MQPQEQKKPEQNDSKGVIAMLVNLIDPDLRELIGFLGGMIALMMLLAFAAYVGLNGKSFLDLYFKGKAQPDCWDLRELQGKAYRFNKCTGETLLVEPAQPASAPVSR